MTDTDTDSGPTPGPWYTGEGKGQRCRIRTEARTRFDVLESGVDVMVARCSPDKQIPEEEQLANARLIAAAGTAAHELPDEYDPVRVLDVLPEIISAMEECEEVNEDRQFFIPPSIYDALQKARRDDASQ